MSAPDLDFVGGLSHVERLEVLIRSPLLRLSTETLPTYGNATKPSLAEPAALIAFGVATLIFGSDRAADREVRAHWPRLRTAFRSAGYRVPDESLRSHNFRDYRDKFLGGGLSEDWKAPVRELFVGLALEVGLFPESDAAWNEPHLDGIVSADGTWFSAASEVRNIDASRTKLGSPRVLDDVDGKNKADKKGWGYMFCITTVRGSEDRLRVVLDITHAPRSAEMDVVVPVVKLLRGLLGDRFRCFDYDGAMRGIHHREIRSAGIVSVNKPRGVRRLDQHAKFKNTDVGSGAKILEPVVGCPERHLLTVTGGSFWEIGPKLISGYLRTRVLKVTDIRRSGSTSEGFDWELDLLIPCRHGDHTFTVDPNATLPCATGAALKKSGGGALTMRSKVNLSEDLRIVQVHDDDFAKIYGRRNDSECGNKNLKSDFGLGHRARSYSVERHDTDLWLYALLSNSLVWAEHTQRQRESRRSRLARVPSRAT